MCQTKFISNISIPAINNNFVKTIIKRSDNIILQFKAKMSTAKEAEIVRNLLLDIERFRTCDCSNEIICKIHAGDK